MAFRELFFFSLRRDVASRHLAALFAVGWAASTSLTALGYTFAAQVTAINVVALVASLLSVMASTSMTVNDRDGVLELYLAQWGRGRYALSRAAANLTTSLILSAAVAAPYVAARGSPPVLLSAVMSAGVSSLLGTYLALVSKNKDRAYALAVSAWTGLALAYDVLIAFISLIMPLGEEALAALQLINPLKLGPLAATAAVDPYLLTMGALGEYVVAHWGQGGVYYLAASLYLAWATALVFAVYDTAKRADL